ncbi:unnamed protein product [Porites evermanni]|uniref:Uncharacterized protein n=1 Tax=Porites evermanni TaxID=104178 RepID=A0ABN8SCL6_9CNID|nr:unnamed protein product [Porites evermanni]
MEDNISSISSWASYGMHNQRTVDIPVIPPLFIRAELGLGEEPYWQNIPEAVNQACSRKRGRGRSSPPEIFRLQLINTNGKLETKTKGIADKCSDLACSKKYALTKGPKWEARVNVGHSVSPQWCLTSLKSTAFEEKEVVLFLHSNSTSHHCVAVAIQTGRVKQIVASFPGRSLTWLSTSAPKSVAAKVPPQKRSRDEATVSPQIAVDDRHFISETIGDTSVVKRSVPNPVTLHRIHPFRAYNFCNKSTKRHQATTST